MSCEDFLRDGGQPSPDADISGIGVVLAFTFSAYITFALVLLSYFFGEVDNCLLNEVDTRIFLIRPRHERPAESAESGNHRVIRFEAGNCLRQAILALSDQQIMTGIAIMAAGFQGLRVGDIDAYHYQTVLYLGWMSSSVHLSAISMIAPILKKRPALKIWRLAGMAVLMVLLAVALVPTTSDEWGVKKRDGLFPENSGWGVPTECFWDKL